MTRPTYRALRSRLEWLRAQLDACAEDYAHDEAVSGGLATCAGMLIALTDAVADKRDPLPAGQQRVLAFLKDFHGKHGFMPTRKEIGQALDFNDSNAQQHLESMARNGWIRLRQGEARGIEIIEDRPAKPLLTARKRA